jgi:hypothetical protein
LISVRWFWRHCVAFANAVASKRAVLMFSIAHHAGVAGRSVFGTVSSHLLISLNSAILDSEVNEGTKALRLVKMRCSSVAVNGLRV